MFVALGWEYLLATDDNEHTSTQMAEFSAALLFCELIMSWFSFAADASIFFICLKSCFDEKN